MKTDNNAREILKRVESCITDLENKTYRWEKKYRINDVYDELSIFDWWNEYLSISQLKDMRRFLRTAINLGFTGYVCFKVGAKGCANGMWAYEVPSTTGYSPDEGECLYKSFVSSYNYWAFKINDTWFPEDDEYDSIKTVKGLKTAIAEARKNK